MKKIITLLLAGLCSLSVLAASSSEDRDKAITSELKSVTNLLIEGNIENTTILLVNPDAYIGNLFPSNPFHFAAGVALSGTVFNTKDIVTPMQNISNIMTEELKDSDFSNLGIGGSTVSLDLSFDLPAQIPLPTAGASVRLGGLFLPFDVGFYGTYAIPGSLDSFVFSDFSATIKYTSFGLDLRYRVLEEKGLLPEISVGCGYTYINEGIIFDAEKNFAVENSSLGNVKGSFKTNADLDIKQHNIFAQVQVSKRLIKVFTPYIGTRLALEKNTTEINWSYSTYHDFDPGIEDLNKNCNYKKSSDFGNCNAQLFGGLGLNLAIIQLGFNVQWNPKSNYLTAGFSTSLKI